jgi:hypothetical protein
MIAKAMGSSSTGQDFRTPFHANYAGMQDITYR